mgnify:CR=1 FL=1
MARAVITAADVHEVRGGELRVPRGAVVTPLARDVARERGVLIVEVGASPEATAGTTRGDVGGDTDLESRVRQMVTSLLGGASNGREPVGRTTAGPVKHVDSRRVVMEPFAFDGPGPDQRVHATDVVTSADGAPMAAGYLTLTEGSFPWTLTYDEVQIVLEGELHIGTRDGIRVGLPGDVLYVPKGSEITFGTPSWARFVYVTFPADWAG